MTPVRNQHKQRCTRCSFSVLENVPPAANSCISFTDLWINFRGWRWTGHILYVVLSKKVQSLGTVCIKS